AKKFGLAQYCDLFFGHVKSLAAFGDNANRRHWAHRDFRHNKAASELINLMHILEAAMKVTRDMTIKEVLAFDEEKMLDTLEMISGNFARLRYKTLRKAMEKRVTVEQAAKIGRVPLSEVLFVLNLALGV